MDKKFPEGHDFKESKELADEQSLSFLKENEALKVRRLTAETIIAEKRKEIVLRCALWMRCTVWIAAIFLFLFFSLTIIDFIIMIFGLTTKWGIDFSSLTNHKEHLMMFVLSLLSAYSLLAPYLLLKGILTRNDKIDTPLVEASKDGVDLLSKSHN